MRENYQNTTKAEGGSGRFCCDTSKINPNNPSPRSPIIIFRITTCLVNTLLWWNTKEFPHTHLFLSLFFLCHPMSGWSLLTSLFRWYTRDQRALFPVHWIHCRARSVPCDHFRDNQTNWPLAFRWIWRHCLLESRTYFFHTSQSTKINLAVLRVSQSFLYDCALYTRIAQPREIFA